MQVPPAYSALKIAGERAYDLAREGAEVILEARPVTIHRIELVDRPDIDHAVLEAECGKGTYVRAIARDLGRLLGTRGHVSMLRRACVGPFLEEDLVPLDELRARAEAGDADLFEALDPVGAALEENPPARRHPVRCPSPALRPADHPARARCADPGRPCGHPVQETLIAIGDAQGGEVLPHRVFNWAKPSRSAGAPGDQRPPREDFVRTTQHHDEPDFEA